MSTSTDALKKFGAAFSGEVFWLEFCSLKSLFSADIRPIFVKFGDYVGNILNPKKYVPDFRFLSSFLRYNVYSENSAQKHYFEFKKNYEEIPRRSNKNSRHMLLDQYVKITLRLKRNVLIKMLSRINVSASMIRFPFCSKVRIRNHCFFKL